MKTIPFECWHLAKLHKCIARYATCNYAKADRVLCNEGTSCIAGVKWQRWRQLQRIACTLYICLLFKEALQSNLPPNIDLQHKWWKVYTTRRRVMAEKNASHGVLTSRSAEWWPGVKLQCYCCEFTVLLLPLLLLLLVAFLPVNLNSFATQSRIYHLVQEGGPRPKRFLSGIFG